MSEWGQREHDQWLADIAEVKAGTVTLEEAQKRASKRARQSGMTHAQAQRALRDARIERLR